MATDTETKAIVSMVSTLLTVATRNKAEAALKIGSEQYKQKWVHRADTLANAD